MRRGASFNLGAVKAEIETRSRETARLSRHGSSDPWREIVGAYMG